MSDRSLALVDTTVLVYALTDGPDRRHEQARSLLRTLMEEDRLCLSTQVLQELFVTLTRKANVATEDGVEVVEDLALWPVFCVDPAAVAEAGRLSRSARLSFRSAQMVVSASRMQASDFYTEDLSSGQLISGVRLVNPFRT